jgi:hypothetical protein
LNGVELDLKGILVMTGVMIDGMLPQGQEIKILGEELALVLLLLLLLVGVVAARWDSVAVAVLLAVAVVLVLMLVEDFLLVEGQVPSPVAILSAVVRMASVEEEGHLLLLVGLRLRHFSVLLVLVVVLVALLPGVLPKPSVDIQPTNWRLCIVSCYILVD